MSDITSSSIAPIVGSGVKNVQHQPSVTVVPRKAVIIGTYDETTKTSIVANKPILVTSAEDVGDKTGFGFMLHRLAKAFFKGSNNSVETYIIPQTEAAGGAKAAGSIDFGSSTGVLAGTLHLYINNEHYPVNITAAMTEENIADAVVAKINSVKECPVVAAKTAVTFVVTLTAKGEGTYGNGIKIHFNEGFGEVTPTGVVYTVVQPTSGTGIPDIQDALDALGTGDGANEDFFTALVHGYGQDTTTLDAISAYVGSGNDYSGCYDKAVHKPFRSLVADTVAGSGGLSSLISLGDGRKSDRASGLVAVPGSYSNPIEIAAQAIGYMERVNNIRAEENYNGIALAGIHAGAKADRWTSEYTNRDNAFKAGISATIVKNGVVYLQKVVTFYHPDSVNPDSNGYRDMCNISKLQNILYNQFLTFDGEKWKGITVVSDKALVTDVVSKEKVRDLQDVKDELAALIYAFAGKAWIYEVEWALEQLSNSDAVVARTGNNGFTNKLKFILSGQGDIIDTVSEFDTSIAVLQ